MTIDVRRGLTNELVEFYGTLLGMRRLDDGRDPERLSFGRPRLRLDLCACDAPQVHPHYRRCVLAVDDLEQAEVRFRRVGRAVQRVNGLSRTETRLYVNDPSGHVLELKQDYLRL